jgi:hypothetical protein
VLVSVFGAAWLFPRLALLHVETLEKLDAPSAGYVVARRGIKVKRQGSGVATVSKTTAQRQDSGGHRYRAVKTRCRYRSESRT